MDHKVFRLATIIALVAVSSFAMANDVGSGKEDLVSSVKKGIDLIYYLKLMALAAFYLAGLFLAGTGLWSAVKSMKPNSQENIGVAIGKFFLGVLLCVLPSFIGLTADTFMDGGSTNSKAGITTKGSTF
jgi:hypothetical protein